MPRAKNDVKGKQVVLNIEGIRKNPSDVCKGFLIKCIVEFNELESTVSLNNKHIRNKEKCLDKFKADIRQKMLDALNVLEWYHETEK